MKLTKQQQEQAKYYYERKILSPQQIARHYDCSMQTVRKYLNIKKEPTEKELLAKYAKWK